MDLNPGAFAGFRQMLRERAAGGLGEADVSDDTVVEERGHASAGTVEKLIRDHEIEGWQIFAQRSDSADGKNALGTEHFQGADVGAVVYVARRNAVAAAVASEKGDATAFECADDDGIRRITEWSLHPNFARVRESGHVVEAAAANDGDFRGFLCTSGFQFGSGLFRFGHSCSWNVMRLIDDDWLDFPPVVYLAQVGGRDSGVMRKEREPALPNGFGEPALFIFERKQ